MLVTYSLPPKIDKRQTNYMQFSSLPPCVVRSGKDRTTHGFFDLTRRELSSEAEKNTPPRRRRGTPDSRGAGRPRHRRGPSRCSARRGSQRRAERPGKVCGAVARRARGGGPGGQQRVDAANICGSVWFREVQCMVSRRSSLECALARFLPDTLSLFPT